ncbi:hypothetical protein SASPL_137805 [Salvia splendens]|uniref:Uncharacterized protein n=1 Tax=Salvia splendens TaxID=180675 RepID=A0A8X8WTZ6_SALSN|nr:hypothetical protein SASPL_137805 [Salvia splendens]
MKKRTIDGDVLPSLKSRNSSKCSSASSFSRSCLSKTPSSRGNHSTGANRSVRFSPVSVIVVKDGLVKHELHQKRDQRRAHGARHGSKPPRRGGGEVSAEELSEEKSKSSRLTQEDYEEEIFDVVGDFSGLGDPVVDSFVDFMPGVGDLEDGLQLLELHLDHLDSAAELGDVACFVY